MNFDETRQGSLLSSAHLERRGALTLVRVASQGMGMPASLDYPALIAQLEDMHRRDVISRTVRVELPSAGMVDFHLLRGGLFLTILRSAAINASFTAPGLCVLRVRLGPFEEEVEAQARESEEFDCSFLYLDSESLRWTYRSAIDRPGSSISVFIDPARFETAIDPSERSVLQSLVPAKDSGPPGAHLVDVMPSIPLRRAAYDLLSLEVGEAVYPLRAEARTLALVAEALAGFARGPSARFDTDDIRALEALRAEIDEEYAQSPTLEQLARRAAMNRRKMTEGFKKLFGMTVHEYRVQQRMKRAAELLREGASAGAVACEVGYADQGSFTTAFRRFFGETPSAFKAH
ncbi:MAG: AraC family transcriptional regulator [Myxococcota bacterium]